MKFNNLHQKSAFGKTNENNAIVNDKLKILEENETKKKLLKMLINQDKFEISWNQNHFRV